MATVAARRTIGGASVAEAQALWTDRRRWPAFVDGFGSFALWHGDWPRAGARHVWDSRPGGRGRVVEQVVAFEPARAQRMQVEDPRLTGTQTVAFGAVEGGVAVALELDYELKRGGIGLAVADVLFVRRMLRESLRRTLDRFAVELRADRELGS